ncbi:hypothetical protein PG993_014078 [Apiospora rasikravindrae]|uniref:Uncharacterized protein n=1 Tax=Apiospora rasikravindrae TaxID=990691 RepID=A0ABR1RSG6_9PEZI
MALTRPRRTICEYFPEGCSPYRWQSLLLRGPREGLDISQALYLKAETQNEELSDDEVGYSLLKSAKYRYLPRYDTDLGIVARPLLSPWRHCGQSPSPPRLAESGREVQGAWLAAAGATAPGHPRRHGGEASTPRQLLDKVRQESCSVNSLTLEALELLVAQFMQVREIFNVTDANNDFPGKEEARRLLGAREGVGEAAKEIIRKAMDRCSKDPAIRSARQAKFEAAEARGERGLLVQLPEPFGVVSLEDSIERLEEYMPEAVKPSTWPGGDGE